MSVTGLLYYTNFNQQVDSNLQDRIQIPARLLESARGRLVVIQDREAVRVQVGENVEDVLVVNPNGTILFSLRPELSGLSVQNIPELDSSWFNFDEPQTLIEEISQDGVPFLINISPIKSSVDESTALFVYTKVSTDEAIARKNAIARLLLGGVISAIVLTYVALFFIFYTQIFKRISQVIRMLRSVADGNLDVRLENLRDNDEITALQRQFNTMVERLRESVKTISDLNKNLQKFNEELEQRVNDRTRDLQIASDVSRDITTVLDEDQLLDQVVNRTKESFGLYHVSVFIYDSGTEELVFRSGSGDVGKRMKEHLKKFHIDDLGIVPTSAKKRVNTLINNVKTSKIHHHNELLPDTMGELALPMVVGNQLVGVLDLQAKEVDRFSEDDVRVLTTLAEQIGISIQNAKLFTEVVEARRQAEKSDQVKSAFLASMSHELRTPLNAIINFTQFLMKGKMGPVTDRQVDALDKVKNSGVHLLNLINDVLDISKIESDSMSLLVEPEVDITEVINKIQSVAEALLDNKPVTLKVDLEENLPVIVGDRQRLMQIFLNIMSNACKFTEEGSILIKAIHQEGNLVISIKDTGPGIAPEEYDAVFETFKQTTSGLRKGSGTGLGMPISKRLVEAHNGTLLLESELGVGTTFTVILPLVNQLKPNFS